MVILPPLPRLILPLLVVTCLAGPALAGLVWEGDPAKGRTVFNNLNFEGAERHSPGTGSILPVQDPARGPIWRVIKPAADKRAEIRGATGWSYHTGKGGTMEQGRPYYLGWSYRFSMTAPTAKSWACFQWKSYPDPANPSSFTQNYPFTMGYDGRTLSLTVHGPDWQNHRERVATLWSQPVAIGEWVDIVLVVNPSLDDQVGYVEIYFNGKPQMLRSGGTRHYHKTMDGLEVAPKWGAYGGGAIGTEITVDLADLRVGTDLASVLVRQAAPSNSP